VVVLIRTIAYLLSGFFPRSKNIFVFGAWFGARFSDNPKYLLNEFLSSDEYKGYRFVWIGNVDVFPTNYDERVCFVRRNSLRSMWYQLRANSAFFSHGFQDVGSLNLLRGARTFQLWHGFPVKHIGADDPGNSNEGQHVYERYQYFLANSEVMARRICTAFKNYGAAHKSMIIAPQPREDYLRYNANNTKLKNKIKQQLGIESSTTVISYFPTFRDNTEQVFSFIENDNERLKKTLQDNQMVILERQHFARDNDDIRDIEQPMNTPFINLPESIEVQDVLLISDYLISDYSSIYIDFLHLNKPIIHFLYDGDNYLKHDRGLYCDDPRSEFGGPIANSVDDLIKLLQVPKKQFQSQNLALSNRLALASQPTLIQILESEDGKKNNA
jgi:CDP-glycerol glycerophosphotransferase